MRGFRRIDLSFCGGAIFEGVVYSNDGHMICPLSGVKILDCSHMPCILEPSVGLEPLQGGTDGVLRQAGQPLDGAIRQP